MRPAIYVVFFIACAAIAPQTTRSALASAASVIVESLPYLVGGALLAPILGRYAPTAIALAGCGCGRGPGARSIPVAVATALLLNPWVAAARWIAAVTCSLFLRADRHVHEDPAPVIDEMVELAPSAALCGAVVTLAPSLDLAHRSPGVALALGLVLGMVAAPCALGGVALAAALHAQSALAAYAMLAVCGICDMRVWISQRAIATHRDRMSYAALAAATAAVAAMHGATLVHPRLTPALWCCALYFSWLALRSESVRASAQRWIVCALFALCVLGSPAPPEIASEATLDDAYAGERIDFRGQYTQNAGIARVVRYAITCCRADARPVGIRLSSPSTTVNGTWVRARGTLRATPQGLVLQAPAIAAIAPPADPFIYR